MIPLTPRFSRISRTVLVIAVACVAATLAGLIFVAAQSKERETPRASFATSSPDASTKARIANRFAKLPLSFERNAGQTDQSVKFLSHGPGYDLFLTATETVLNLRHPNGAREPSVLRLKMIGANADPHVEGRDELPGKVNYFVGNDTEKWRRNVPTYRKVHYTNVYPGIDLVYYGNQRELEYDFVVAAGANPRLIKFSVDGAQRIRLDRKGNLVAALKHGEVQLNKPFVYQLADDGSRSEVKGSYVINGSVVSFKVGGADPGKPLVIDPVLSYSTYLGGNGSDQAFGIAVDAQGSAYVTGTAEFGGFPTTPGAFKTSDFGGAFVTKLDPAGSSLVYSTFLNGTGNSTGLAIALDASGNAYVTGFTTANDFPVVNGLKTSSHFFKTTDSASNWNNVNTGLNGEVSALAVAPSAPNILYAGTQHGPFRSTDAGATWTATPTTGLPSFSSPQAIAVDPNNASVVYVGLVFDGVFKSTNGGDTWSAVPLGQVSLGVNTIVFDPSTSSTIYVGSTKGVFKSTDSGATWTSLNNFGTSTIPIVKAIAVDPTTPTTVYAGTLGNGGLFKSTNGGSNWTAMNNGISGGEFSIVNSIVIDPSNPSTIYTGHGFSGVGNGVSKSTNAGTSWTPINNGVGNDRVNALVIDPTNTSTLFAATETSGILKTTNGGAAWTSANTGFGRTEVRALVRQPSNAATLFAGTTGNILQTRDAFVSKLNPTGSGLLFSTYLGGSALDTGNGIAVDNSGNIVVVGETTSTNFPAVNAIQSTVSATEDCSNGFVTKLNPAAPSYVFSTYLGGNRCDVAQAVAVDASANVYVTGNTRSADFPVAGAFQATIGNLVFGNAFVTKLTSAGSLNYSTYLGGSVADHGFAIALDNSGNAYVTGLTSSNNFPTLNPIQPDRPGQDVFVTKLNSSGSGLVYSTYLGGAASDTGRGIAVDASGSAYVTGFTSSSDFPIVAGALRTRSPLFKSVDAAAKWENDNYGLNGITVTSLAVHPTQPSTLYAGSLSGVFKSTDAGRTWSAINNGMTGGLVIGLVIDPLTPSTLYVATANTFGGLNAVFKSTDAGNSWNLRSNGLTQTRLLSLAIDPVTPATLYVGASGGARVFKTTDGADNWAPTGAPPIFPVSLAVDPHTPTRIFAADLSSTGGVFRSIDSGASWQSVSLAQTGAQASFVGVSPVTPNLVYATTSGNGVFKSVDGGDTWTSVRPQSRFGKVVFDPVSASTLYLIGDAEGLLKSTDSGQTWKLMNNGLPGPGGDALAINPLRTSTLYLFALGDSGEDAFVTRINPAGNALIYSTFLGGVPAPNDSLNTNDEGFGIALDSAGNAYIAGLARSPFFPTTPNSVQPFNRGFNDAFVAKLTMSHIISGHVLETGGAPVSGAEVVLSDGTSLTTVVTDTDGSYEFSRLRQGGSFTVSASKPHFTMAPPSQSFNNLNGDQVLNFTATATNAPFFTISGQIKEIGGVPTPGIVVSLQGSQVGTRTTDSNGNFSFEVAGGGNYTLTPSGFGFTFDPPTRTFNNLNGSQTANFTAMRQEFVVTNTNNHGTGSLRDAIINANARPGTDVILFNIPGAGVKVIKLVTALPEITDPVLIDGSTQPGSGDARLIELNGEGVSFANGLVITAGDTSVHNLAIVGFAGAGIVLRSCDNNFIQGNYIGVDASGNSARGNGTGMLLDNSSHNLIGGFRGNVISGNKTNGIEIRGTHNVLRRNLIGTNAAGTAAIGNTDSGVLIMGAPFTNNVIGGDSFLQGNLISGNQRGILIEAPGNAIQGNLIGTDAAGRHKIPNLIGIDSRSQNTLIGGLTEFARNVISGNGDGVIFGGAGSVLQGNFIGTDVDGAVGLGNSSRGVVASGAAVIGGTVPGARNVIAANGLANITLLSDGSGNGVTVHGNYIGTDRTGSRALTDASILLNTTGIAVFSSKNQIGGVGPGAGNVISGNFIGIILTQLASQNVMQGNLIGLNAPGNEPVPNGQAGIEFFFDAFDNIVGGTQSGAANKIAFNGFRGVAVSNGGAVRNSIRGNSIFSNGGLGIDLGGDGLTPNDSGDPDSGGNNRQNFPVLTSVTSAANSTTIQGTLNSTPNTTFQIDFYSSAALDQSGNGEGALFLGAAAITTDGSGNATINAVLPVALGAGRVVTATATDPNGNTSEFSAGDPTLAAGSLEFSVNLMQVIEDVGLATITVLRKGGSAGTLTVDFATANDTAIAGQDYTATSGTLTFNNGETSKNIQVPILTDGPTEPDEFFTISLHNPSNIEAISPPTTVFVTIQDGTTAPFVFLDNRFVTEGNAGTTTDVSFTATLSAQTGRTVTVNFATSDIIASGGVTCNNQGIDYESKSGTLTFQPGNTIATISIKICGDANAEANETFRVTVSDSANVRVRSRQGGDGVVIDEGVGTIVDDDVMELLLEESPPVANQAAAIDALLFLRDPFRVMSLPDWLAVGSDRNTRVMFFVRHLELNPGESASAVIVRLRNSTTLQLIDVPAEDVRSAPGVDFTQVIMRLPDNLAPGTYIVTVRAHSRSTNTGTIRIAP